MFRSSASLHRARQYWSFDGILWWFLAVCCAHAGHLLLFLAGVGTATALAVNLAEKHTGQLCLIRHHAVVHIFGVLAVGLSPWPDGRTQPALRLLDGFLNGAQE